MRIVRYFAILMGFLAVAYWLGVSPLAQSAESSEVVRISRDQVGAYEGVWYGPENVTPLGPMPFAMHFRWEDDGSLHAHSALSKETWIDLRFHEDESGNWLLTESAGLAGIGEQSKVMHPVRAAGDTLYYEYLADPEYLNCRMTTAGDKLFLHVNVRGEEHAQFLLEKLEGEQAEQVAQSIAAGAERSGEDDWERLNAVSAGEEPVELQNARARVKTEPESAEAHLALGRRISEVIEDAPMAEKAVYAQQMLTALQTAVELDPELVDAQFSLAQYYLQAPPIAGGSLELAAEQAERLDALGAPLGQVVWAQIDAKHQEYEAAIEKLDRVLKGNPDLPVARKLRIQYSSRVTGEK